MPENDDKANNQTEKENGKDEKRALLGLAPVETTHKLKLKDRSLEYQARAGAIPLKDEMARRRLRFSSWPMSWPAREIARSGH